jgi:4-amino-4-deoxy-L-arabinose transferase-like glycosyltransferase
MDSLLKKFACLLPIDHEELYRFLLVTVILSIMSKLVLSILMMIYHPNGVFESSDSVEYHQLALNLLQHGEFSRSPQAPYEPEILRTPAYPLLLACLYRIFGVHPTIVVFAQIALSVATIFIAFKIATLLAHKQAGLLTAMLLTADPVTTYYTQVLLTETVFTTTVSLCLLLFLHSLAEPSKWQWSTGTSICLALSTYIRPTSYYLGFIFPLIFFLMARPTIGWRYAAKPALVSLSLYVVLTGGWQLHNYVQTGSLEFSQLKNQYLFIAKAAAIVAVRDSLSLEDAQQRLAAEHFQSLSPELRTASQIRLYESQGDYAVALILKHPTIFLWTTLRGMLASLFGPSNLSHLFGLDNVSLRTSLLRGDFSGFSLSHWTMALSSWMYGAVFLIILYLGVLLLFVQSRLFHSQGMVLLIFIVLYMLITSSGPEAYSRFRLPAMPALCVLAAAGLIHSSKVTRPLWNSQQNCVAN